MVTYRFRVKDKHAPSLNRQARAVNHVWNYCNDVQKQALKWGKQWPSNYDLQKLTAGSSKELGISADTINKICEQYVKSRKQHKKPHLRWRDKKSLGWVPMRGREVRIKENGFLYARKTYSVWLSRKVPDGARICDGSNFSRDSQGRWFINLVIDVSASQKRTTDKMVGIDLGLKDLAVFSDGKRIEAPKFFRKTESDLATAQRANKKRRVTAIHAKMANQRKDFLHKVSANIVRDYDKIVVGDVDASALAQTVLAKSVNDAGWSMLRDMLRYKAIAHGAEYIEVSERFTTQICSDCGVVGGPKGIANLGIRQWECECGSVHDRDVNSAINIARRGHSTLAEGAVQ
jgi:putative transposase